MSSESFSVSGAFLMASISTAVGVGVGYIFFNYYKNNLQKKWHKTFHKFGAISIAVGAGNIVNEYLGYLNLGLAFREDYVIGKIITNFLFLPIVIYTQIILSLKFNKTKEEEKTDNDYKEIQEIKRKDADTKNTNKSNDIKNSEPKKTTQTVNSVKPITNAQKNINHVNFLKEIANNEATRIGFEGIYGLVMADGKWAIEANSRDYLIFENEEKARDAAKKYGKTNLPFNYRNLYIDEIRRDEVNQYKIILRERICKKCNFENQLDENYKWTIYTEIKCLNCESIIFTNKP